MKKKITVPEIRASKGGDKVITMVTCYDYTNAKLVDESNVEMLKELVTNYMEIIEKREVPEDEDVKKAIQEIIDGKI